MCVCVYIYLYDIVNNLTRTLNNILHNEKHRINIEGMIMMNVSGVNKVQDFLVSHSEEAKLPFKLLPIIKCGRDH